MAPESTFAAARPAATLRPRLDLCLPTASPWVKAARVLVVDGTGKTGDSLARKLESARRCRSSSAAH